MRKIKFRAWDKLKKIMLNNVDAIHLDNSESGIEQIYAISTSKEFEINWRPQSIIELMQFTGLIDKNGKEIYEGDLVVGVTKKPSEVVFQNYGFNLKRLTKEGSQIDNDGKAFMNGWLDWFKNNNLEVVGNIYENPELLKGPDVK